jgi:hypothetical protein
VVFVVFLFLRNVRSTTIPGVAVAISVIGTFAVMYLGGYPLDNLSLSDGYGHLNGIRGGRCDRSHGKYHPPD